MGQECAVGSQITIQGYKIDQVGQIDISDLELSPSMRRSYLPISEFYWGELPNLKILLLERGLARIKNEASASDEYKDAQNRAKEKKIGLWFTPSPTPSLTATKHSDVLSQTPTSTPSIVPPTPTLTKTVTPTLTPTFLEDFEETVYNIDWQYFGQTLLAALIAIIGFRFTPELSRILMGWIRRHQLDLVLLGEEAVGKTVLYKRLLNPSIPISDLENLEKTNVLDKKKSKIITMGQYRITPVFTDTPGKSAGIQFEQLAESAFFAKKKIWIIILSSTKSKNVTLESPEVDKVNKEYIAKQSGALKLMMGFLSQSKKKTIHKPKMVIACISKFDIFSDSSPESDNKKSIAAKEKLERLFAEHITTIQKGCEEKDIPFALIYISAYKGWGVRNRSGGILDTIEENLYRDKK